MAVLAPLLPIKMLADALTPLMVIPVAYETRPWLPVPLLSRASMPPSPMVAVDPRKTGAVEPPLSPAKARVPALTVTPPVKVLLLPKMSVPRPVLVRE